MLRLIVVAAFAFIGLQFPSYYFAYIQQIDIDARALESGNTPQAVTDRLRRQQRQLMLAEPMQWPLAFAEAFDADRAEEALFNVWEPQMPGRPEEWAYGGAGLILGFLFTGIVASLFGSRRPSPTPAKRPAAPAERPWAEKAQAKSARPARTGSRIPVSTGNLREASRIAKETLRQAREAVSNASSGPTGATEGSRPPSPLARRTPMAVQRATVSGAVIPSRHRPPAITRRFESGHIGAIERMTQLRD